MSSAYGTHERGRYDKRPVVGALYGCRAISGVVSVGAGATVAVCRSSFLVNLRPGSLLLFLFTVSREARSAGLAVAVHLLLAVLCN